MLLVGWHSLRIGPSQCLRFFGCHAPCLRRQQYYRNLFEQGHEGKWLGLALGLGSLLLLAASPSLPAPSLKCWTEERQVDITSCLWNWHSVRAQDLEKFKPELLGNTLYFLQRLNHSSGLHNVHTKDQLFLGRKSSSQQHSKVVLWYEAHSREERESEMKGLYEIPFLICFTLCLFPRGKRDFWNPLLQNEFEVVTNNAYDWQLYKRKIIPLLGKTLEGERNHPVFAEKGHVALLQPLPGHNIKQKISSQPDHFQRQQQDLMLQGWRPMIKLYLLSALSAPPPHHFHCR